MGGLLSDVGAGIGRCFLSIGLRSRALMVSMTKLLVPEFALLPLHAVFGNESDDDLTMENILRSVVCCSRCRISNRWSNALLSSLSLGL